MEEYRKWPNYASRIAQDLQPLWKHLSRRYDWGQTTDFWQVQNLAEDQCFAEEGGEGLRDADLARYVAGLLDTVGRHMGLLEGGTAARWAMPFVQFDATKPFGQAGPLSPPHTFFLRWEQIAVTLKVSDLNARISLTHHDGTTDTVSVLDSPDHTFHDWDDLRRQAHAVIDEELSRMQGEFDRAYAAREGPYVRRYQSALYDPEDIALLRVLLTATPNRRPEMDRARRERLRRFAKKIGIDFPPA